MPSAKQALERHDNISAILHLISASGEITRRELAKKLSLSWGCVSELVGLLIEEKILVEKEKTDRPTKGRVPALLCLSKDIHVLGVDVNKTGISFCVCDLYEQRILEQTRPLDIIHKEALLKCLFSVIAEARSRFPGIRVISLAMQGLRDRAAGIWRFPFDTPEVIDFQKDIACRVDIPVIIEHDPNCMLFGHIENTESNSKLLVRIDQGIGAALYKYNRFFDDSLLELGYLTVGEKGQTLAQLLVACAGAQTEATSAALQTFGKYFGITLANFSNMIGLEEIILCGDFMKYQMHFLPVLKKHYEEHVIDIAKATVITADIANAAFGAARLAVKQFPYVGRK